MQRDNLEKFILDNREDFDRAVPSLKVWAEIDKKLEQNSSKRITLWQSVRIAAAILVILVIGGVIGNYLDFNTSAEQAAYLESVPPEFVELEQFYNQQINQKYQQLVNYQKQHTVEDELKEIDQVMEELKLELLEAPAHSGQQILRNLIKTYQIKIQILERVLEHHQPGGKPIVKPESNEISI